MTDWQKKRDGLEQRFRDRLARLEHEETRDARTHRLCVLGGALEAVLKDHPAARSERLRRELMSHVSEHHREVVWDLLIGPDFDV